ncbi:hypothetical protein E2C01_087574 [Portunus trituberculatus]|uniref:Uncharacterized protein n=1 Tax=Portunus trituberculatus TaxID=210409 RepID=A0A5B7J8H5_PORTR|nr:hypothetical protein [Portunus trituberculatus]
MYIHYTLTNPISVRDGGRSRELVWSRSSGSPTRDGHHTHHSTYGEAVRLSPRMPRGEGRAVTQCLLRGDTVAARRVTHYGSELSWSAQVHCLWTQLRGVEPDASHRRASGRHRVAELGHKGTIAVTSAGEKWMSSFLYRDVINA